MNSGVLVRRTAEARAAMAEALRELALNVGLADPKPIFPMTGKDPAITRMMFDEVAVQVLHEINQQVAARLRPPEPIPAPQLQPQPVMAKETPRGPHKKSG